jgi:hypothetical protein
MHVGHVDRTTLISGSFLPSLVGQINLVNPKKNAFVQTSRQKYSASEFRKIMVLSVHPASMKRGVRPIVTKRGARDAMDAVALQDVRCRSVQQKRVVLAPLGWC